MGKRTYVRYPQLTSEQTKLVEDNVLLVWHIFHKYYPNLEGDEDASQCGMLGLCKAAVTYDPTRPTKFSTYAGVAITNELNMYCRRRKKLLPECSSEYTLWESSKTDDVFTIADTIAIPEKELPESVIESIDNISALKKAISHLPKPQREIFELLLQGFTEPEIYQHGINGKKLSRSYINRLKNKGMEQLRGTLKAL